MTVWEKFVSDVLNTYKKEDLICRYYLSTYGGNEGCKCSKQCPFRQWGGNCFFYDNLKNRRKVSHKEIEEILNSEVD